MRATISLIPWITTGAILLYIFNWLTITDINKETAIESHPVYRTETDTVTETETVTVTKITTRPYILADTQGRLGNMMFMHASAYALAHQTNHTNILMSNLLHYFPGLKGQHINKSLLESLSFSKAFESGAGIYMDKLAEQINKMPHVQLIGYFQSFKYFKGFEKDLRQQFQIDGKVRERCESTMLSMINQKLNTTADGNRLKMTYVGVHIRRGDFESEYFANFGYVTAPVTYLIKAMAYYKNRYKHVIFVVCSDDIKWSIDNLGKRTDTVFIHNETPIYDLTTLMLCNHTVITTGTFSWWAGWLAGGQVVLYSKYPKEGSELAKLHNLTDYYPSNWIPMS